MKEITIYELLPFLKHGFCVFTRSGNWIFYRKKPEIIPFINFFGNKAERWQTTGFGTNLSEMFNIAPFDGDWKDSLMECGNHIADGSKKVADIKK